MTSSAFSCPLPDAAATDALGAGLAAAYQPSPGGAVLHLEGELGAGKTSCVRSLLRTLGVEGTIRSPTYTLVETYETGSGRCVHVDLYRLTSPSEVEELGLRDSFDRPTLMMVEWPRKGGVAVPRPDLALTLAYEGEGRRASIDPATPRGRRWLDLLLQHARFQSYVPHLT